MKQQDEHYEILVEYTSWLDVNNVDLSTPGTCDENVYHGMVGVFIGEMLECEDT